MGLLLLAVTACEDGRMFNNKPSLFEQLNQLNFEAQPPVATSKDDLIGEAEAVEQRPTKKVFPGSDRYVQPAPPPDLRELGGGAVQINFENTDLREVVRIILGDTLGVDYVYDPRVQGSVTVSTSRPLSRQHLLSTLETLLRMNGAALVVDEDVYRVIPVGDAINRTTVPQLGPTEAPIRAGFGITIVPLRHTSANEIAQLLEPVISVPGALRVDPLRNLILVSGTRRERTSIVDTIEIFDVDWLAGRSAGIFPLSHTSPDTLLAELQVIFGEQAAGPLAGLIQFQPIERLNAILVVAARSSLLAQADEWITRLDQGNVSGLNLYVYFVQNGKAEDLAAILNDAFSGVGGQARRDRASQVAPGRQEVVVTTQQEGQTPAPAQRAASSGGISLGESGDLDVRVIPDDINNALLILASPVAYQMVQAALRKLDIVPLQVLIEATIVEVTLNNQLRYGVQYFLEAESGRFAGSAGLFSGDNAVLGGLFPGFNFILSEEGTTRFVLDALESITDIRVISSPHLVVRDNQAASLQVGDEVPVTTRQSTSITDPNAPTVNNVEFRDTGVILTVTPRINAGGLVNMEVEQEVSNVAEAAAEGTLTPTISQRKISSTVAVQSGQTVVLGGLISENEREVRSGIPVLSRIPILGALFSNTSNTGARTELIVFITPRVIRDATEAERVTDEIRNRMQNLAPPDRMGAAPKPPFRE